MNPEIELALEVAKFHDDPLGFVIFAFPWDDPKSGIQQVELQEPWKSKYNVSHGPDKWACEFLDRLGQEIKARGFDGSKAVDPIQFATASGHGIGKSTLTAWLILFIMSCYPKCKGVVTATTQPQLATKTWSELGKWLRLCITQHWFVYSSGRASLSLYHKDDKEGWRVDAQTSKEENSESFAGLHAASSVPFYIFDEASGIPDKIFEVREGGTTDGMPMVFDFGNPTRNSGRFYEECVGDKRHRFIVQSIDSRDVAITNPARLNQWIEDYGEDSDFVKVRVRGVFPSQGSAQFISAEDVDSARARPLFQDASSLILGVDVARFGDNETVIYPRLGNDARSFPPRRFRGLDVVQVSGKVAECVQEFSSIGRQCKAICVDGTGLGAGVVDNLIHMGYPVINVNFGGRPIDSIAYRMKADEIWGKMKDALREGLRIPSEGETATELYKQLISREYGHTMKGQVALESKSDMADRGLESPDIADALALTFAVSLPPLEMLVENTMPVKYEHDYDPLDW